MPKAEDLPPRCMKDSFFEGILPLSKSLELQEKYTTFLGKVRIARLLEDVDIFAVYIGYKYIYAPSIPADVSSPFILVTAYCDQLDYTKFERKNNEDIKLSGFVFWVGKSSMEIVVWLEQHSQGSWHKITRAIFILAARNATATQSAMVNSLKAHNDQERKILEEAEARKVSRSNSARSHISKVLPNAEEMQIIHELYKNTGQIETGTINEKYFPYGVVAMENIKISNIIFCQPEDRNFYNTVFGGFTMRHATELAWALGYQFFRSRPIIAHISDINFHSPVAVNALMQMTAQIVFTHESFAQVFVKVVALDAIEGKATKCNTVHIVLESPKNIRTVYPKTYHEAMLYIDGKRHFESAIKNNTSKKVDALDEYFAKLSKS